MSVIDSISRDLQASSDLSQYYTKIIGELQKFSFHKPVEASKLISSAARGIKRLERDKKRLNTLMEKQIELDLKEDGDQQYVHSDE